MKKITFLSCVVSLVLLTNKGISQGQSWVEMMQDPTVNFYDVQQAFEQYWSDPSKSVQVEVPNPNANIPVKWSNVSTPTTITKTKKPGWKTFKRWEDYMKPRLYPSGDRSVMINAMNEYYDTYYSNDGSEPNRGMEGGTPTIQAANWTLIGPTTTIPTGGGAGRINFVRFDPTSTNIIYVGSPGGGCWKTTNGGTSWATTTDNLPVIGCTDVAINPLNNQIVYLATGDGDASDTYSIGVYKSTNAGATWNTTGLSWAVTNGRVISRLLINPINPNTIHAASSNGIYRSINAGATWTQITGTNGINMKDIEYRPGDTTTVYACSTTRFYKSTNGGTSYTNITSGLPATTAVSRLSIAVTAANAAYVYLLAANTASGFQGVYRSIDNGTTFTTRSTTPNLLGWSNTGSDTGGQGWYDLALAVSPSNADHVMVGGINIWRSTNGGTNWTINAHWTGSGAPYVHADIHALEYIPGSTTTYYAGCDGGLFRTTNSGTGWTDLSNGLQISQAYRIGLSTTNQNMLITGWQDNGTNRWSGTATWTRPLGGDGMEAIIDFTNANVQYGELYYGEIYRTTTGGNLTTNIVQSGGTGVNADGDWVTPYIMNPQRATTLVVGKANAYKSVNRGTNWTALGTVTGGTGNIIAMAYAPSDSNYLYTAKINRFYASTNGGTTFTDRTGTLPVASAAITYIAVASNNPQHVWVTFSGYSAANKVFYSANAGTTWTSYGTGLPNIPVNCIVYQNGSATDILYAGTDVGVYYRDNTAGSWSAYNTGLPNVSVRELEIQYTANKLRAATYGRSIWQSDLNTPGTSPPVADFVASRTNICVGNCINFTDLSTGTPTSWAWSFPGGTPTTSTVQNPTNICYNTAGTYNVTLTATNTNGSNSMTKTAYIVVSAPTTLPLVEGFEGGTFLPTGWYLNNPDGDAYTWVQATNANGPSAAGTNSASIDNATPPTSTAGNIDEMQTPKYSFAGLSTATLTFDVAYARYNATYFDSLIVLVSTDCGTTWTRVYAKGSTVLATAPDNSTTVFVPSGPAQWRTETVNLNSYVGQANVMLSFQNKSGWGQMLYVDNINLSGTSNVAGVSIVSNDADNIICSGQSVTFTATPTNGGTTPSYQWQVNGSNVGTNSPTYTTTTLTNGQIVTCIMTSNLPGVTGNPATSNAITMTVNPTPATPTAGSNTPVCTGNTINLTTPTVAGAVYAWTGPSAFSSALQNPTRTGATAAMAGTYSVTVTVGGCTSLAGTTTVVVNNTPATPTASSNTPVCTGNTINLTTPTVAGAVYAWTGPSAFSSALQNPTRTGATAAMAGTYSVTVTVGGCTSLAGTTTVVVSNTPATPTAGSNSPVCVGQTINLTTPTVGGATYAWTGPSSYSASTQNPSRPSATTAMAGTYSVTVTVGGCTSAAGTTTVVVNTAVTPSVSITASPGSTICAGQNVTFTATPTNGGITPSYQWQVNGSNVGTNSATYSSSTLTNGQVVTCILTSNATCASPTTATSNSITITVSSSVTPAVSIAASPGSTICAGQNTTFTATPTNGGSTPSYQWQVNGSNVGTNSATYSTTTLTNGQVVTCIMTSSSSCASPTTGNSNAITMTVNATVTPSVSIAASPGTTICTGQNVTFTATSTNGGTTPSYQWQVNGSTVGTNSATYSTTTLTNGQVVTCFMTSNATCPSPTTANSNSVTMTVNAAVTPSVSIVASPGTTICTGQNVTFTATPTNGGTTPSYQWQVNGSNVGTNSPTYASSVLTNGQIVTCILTSNAACASPTTANSNSVTMTVTGSVTPAVSISSSPGSTICAGDMVTFTATPTNGGTTPSYQWQVNGSNVGTNSSTFSSSTLTNGQIVTCIMTSSSACASPTTGTSNSITMTVNPIPATPTITQVGNDLQSSSATGNQWYFNSVIIPGATGQTYTPTQDGNYTVVVTTVGCSSSASAPFNVLWTGITNTINPYLLTIYPNPSDGNFNLIFNATSESSFRIEITNALGQIVYREEVKNVNGVFTKPVSIVEYGKGVYTITLKDNKNQSTEKIIVY